MEKLKILYVDDEPSNLYLFDIILNGKYQVLTAECGKDGLEVLAGHPDISVVVSDMKMPGMDGIEFIRALKELHPHMRCFILTGYEITPEIEQAMKTGLILQHLSKPMNMNEIASIIDEAINA